MKSSTRKFGLRLSGLLALAMAAIGTNATAAVTEQDAAKLGKELTLVGAERAASKDGSIPEWKGGTPKAKYNFNDPRPDLFASDKPLFAIDASNVDKYKDKLSAGQIELLKTRKGYRMDVYPTRRSCGYPDVVAERTKQNATQAKLTADGSYLAQALGGAFPFPIPKNGAEAVWNHRLRWQGSGRHEYYQTNFINPDGSYYGLAQDQLTVNPFMSIKANTIADANDSQMKIFNVAISPPSRTGEVILAHYFLSSKTTDAWMYFPGQRRVRRLPAFDYDNPIPGYENLETADQYPMFAGALDRYDWKLIGKQEMYIPYNNFKFVAKRKIPEVYLGLFPNRDLMRYELHRVWKVEATVKQGMRHMFAKRTFYLDEDTWMLMEADQYDAQGKLWRIMEATIYPAVELGACVSQEFMSWDLNVNRYMAENATQDAKPTDWLAGDEGRIDMKKFEPDELRRAGER